MASFGDAFKAARSAGKTTFKWQGKSYHTKTKDEMAKTKKAVPKPTPRPDTSQNSGPRSSSVAAENAGPTPAQSQANEPVKAQQDYPRPSRQVGIARPGSAISLAVARKENEPEKDKKNTWKPRSAMRGPNS